MKRIIIFLMLMMQCIDAKVMKRVGGVQAAPSRPVVTPTPTSISRPALTSTSIPAPVPVPRVVDQNAIIQRLDEQLRSPVESAWNNRINDVFDLAAVDRELARDYFIKMRSKMESAEAKSVALEGKEVSTLPAGEEPMKKGTGRPAPSRKPGASTVESTEAPKTVATEIPSGEEMKKGTRPAPSRKPGVPSGGPKKLLTPTKEGGAKPAPSKETAPKVVEQVFSTSKLQELDNNKLTELFNDLLEKLGTVGTNWNSTIVEKIEEKTKYGQKTYNVYGAPVAKWKNDIDTLKKVLISKGVMPEAEVTQKIADRIAQVRAEKTVKPAVQPEVEKAKEALTEDDLVRLIKAQLAEPKTDQIGWVVSIKGNIKALDKLNHAAAMQYHDQFIKITKEKPFLK